MRDPVRNHARLAMLLLVCSPFASAHAREAADWDWVVAPYLFASSVKTDIRAEQPPVEDETSFSDVLSKLDFAMQMRVEGQGDQFGALADITYLALSDDKDKPRYSTSSAVDATIFEAAAVWSPGEKRYSGIEVFAGLRYIGAKLDVEFDSVNPILPDARLGLDKSYADFLVGGRYTAPLSKRWALAVRADTSFGESDGTYNVSALFQYHMTKGAWVFGYRYMDVKIAGRGDSVDLKLYGPVVGYAFGL